MLRRTRGMCRASAPVRRPVPGKDAAADGCPAGELLRDRPRQRGQLHRTGLRAGPGSAYPGRLLALDSLPRPRRGRAVSPRSSARAASTRRRSPRSATSCRPALTPPPGPLTAPGTPSGATSTPPATTGSRSSSRSPRTRPSAPRTSCAPSSSRRTCATAATTRPAPTAPLSAWPKPTGSWPVGAGHHRHAGLPGRRTDRDHLRRRQRHGRLLRRDLRPRPLPSQRAAALPA